jgi:hypothetical protein
MRRGDGSRGGGLLEPERDERGKGREGETKVDGKVRSLSVLVTTGTHLVKEMS